MNGIKTQFPKGMVCSHVAALNCAPTANLSRLPFSHLVFAVSRAFHDSCVLDRGVTSNICRPICLPQPMLAQPLKPANSKIVHAAFFIHRFPSRFYNSPASFMFFYPPLSRTHLSTLRCSRLATAPRAAERENSTPRHSPLRIWPRSDRCGPAPSWQCPSRPVAQS